MKNLECLISVLAKSGQLEDELKTLESQLLSIQEEVEQVVNGKLTQNLYPQYDALVKNYHTLQKTYRDKQQVLQERKIKLKALNNFIDILWQQDKLVVAYDEKLFNTLVDKVIIYKDKQVEVHFKNEQVISM